MKLFPSHGEKKECTLETANVTGRLDSDVGLLVCKRTEVRFPQVRFSSYLLGRSHGYLKACIFVAGIKLEIWWATFQEIKATNKVASFHSARCGKRLMGEHYCDWQGELPITGIRAHIKAALSQVISLICQ